MSDKKAATLSVIRGGTESRRQFEDVVRPWYDMLYRVAYRFTNSVDDAEDLVQEVCLRAYRHIDELVRLENPKTWLLCVLRRLFIDQTRRYDRGHVGSLEAQPDAKLADPQPSPAELTDSALMTRRLQAIWGRLGKEQRSLLALHDIEGYTLAELSEMTGLKIGTLKSRLHRARVKLGRLLHSERDFDGLDRNRRAGS